MRAAFMAWCLINHRDNFPFFNALPRFHQINSKPDRVHTASFQTLMPIFPTITSQNFRYLLPVNLGFNYPNNTITLLPNSL